MALISIHGTCFSFMYYVLINVVFKEKNHLVLKILNRLTSRTLTTTERKGGPSLCLVHTLQKNVSSFTHTWWEEPFASRSPNRVAFTCQHHFSRCPFFTKLSKRYVERFPKCILIYLWSAFRLNVVIYESNIGAQLKRVIT